MSVVATLALAGTGIIAAAPAMAAEFDGSLSVSVASADAETGLTLDVSGEGFTDLPDSSTGSPAAGVYVALRDADTVSYEEINVDQGLAPAVSYVPVIRDGGWSTGLTAPVDSLSRDGDYEVFVWVAHGSITDDTLLAAEPLSLTKAQQDALFGMSEFAGTVSVSVASADAESGLTLDVSGEGFSDLPVASSGKDAAGVYAALRDVKTMSSEAINADTGIVPAVEYVWSGLIRDGSWSTTLEAPAAELSADADYEVIVWVAHGDITDQTLLVTKPITLTQDQIAALFGGDDADDEAGTVSVSVASADAESGLTLAVSGEGFVDLPESSLGSPASGVYAVLRDAKTMTDEDINEDQGLAPALSYIPSERIMDGAWTATLNAPAGKLDPSGHYEVIVWIAHGFITDDTLLARQKVTLTDADLDALFPEGGEPGEGDGDNGAEDPSGISTSVKVTTATAKDGLVVTASGTGYLPDALPAPVGSDGGPGRAMGFYAAIRDANTQSFQDINENSAALAQAWITPDRAKDGTWTATLSVDAAKIPAGADLELLTWSAHGVLTEDTLIDTKPITLTDAQRKALFGESAGGSGGSGGSNGGSGDDGNSTGGADAGDKKPGNDDLRPQPKPAAPSGPVVTCTTETVPATAGTPRLTWGVKSSFASYIEGGIAKGSISTSNGAGRGGGTFSWGSGSGSLNPSGLGTLSFPGVVHFTGHGDILNTTISGVRVQITGANSGVLIANVESQDMEGKDASASNVTFANLAFSSVSATGGTASATLTAAGAKAFAGFYNAGESLDRVTVSMSGATAERTVEVCYDADGNRVNADGTPYSGSDDGLAHTGLGHSNDLVGLVAGLMLAGAVLLIARSRRTGRVGPARR